jgi:uncharacterized protein (TIGR02594 family)
MEINGFSAHMVLGEVLSRCPWMVPALRYAGSHLQVNVDAKTKKQFLSPEDEKKFRHFFNLTHHSPLHDRAGHITAWCSAFVNDCMTEAGIPGTNSPNARSWEHWGIPASSPPRFGDVVVFGREDDRDWKGHGHVGFFLKIIPPTHIAVLGGNQSHKVMVKRYPLSGKVEGVGPIWLIGYRRYPFLA